MSCCLGTSLFSRQRKMPGVVKAAAYVMTLVYFTCTFPHAVRGRTEPVPDEGLQRPHLRLGASEGSVPGPLPHSSAWVSLDTVQQQEDHRAEPSPLPPALENSLGKGSPAWRCVCAEKNAVAWIRDWFFDCVSTPWELLSFSMGLSSILFWLVAQLPQFIHNIRMRSADALSPWFLFQWLSGDLLNLLGCLLTGTQLATQTYTAIYFIFADCCIISQYVFYQILNQEQKELAADCHSDDGKEAGLVAVQQRYGARHTLKVPLLEGVPNGDGYLERAAAKVDDTGVPWKALGQGRWKASSTRRGAYDGENGQGGGRFRHGPRRSVAEIVEVEEAHKSKDEPSSSCTATGLQAVEQHGPPGHHPHHLPYGHHWEHHQHYHPPAALLTGRSGAAMIAHALQPHGHAPPHPVPAAPLSGPSKPEHHGPRAAATGPVAGGRLLISGWWPAHNAPPGKPEAVPEDQRTANAQHSQQGRVAAAEHPGVGAKGDALTQKPAPKTTQEQEQQQQQHQQRKQLRRLVEVYGLEYGPPMARSKLTIHHGRPGVGPAAKTRAAPEKDLLTAAWTGGAQNTGLKPVQCQRLEDTRTRTTTGHPGQGGTGRTAAVSGQGHQDLASEQPQMRSRPEQDAISPEVLGPEARGAGISLNGLDPFSPIQGLVARPGDLRGVPSCTLPLACDAGLGLASAAVPQLDGHAVDMGAALRAAGNLLDGCQPRAGLCPLPERGESEQDCSLRRNCSACKPQAAQQSCRDSPGNGSTDAEAGAQGTCPPANRSLALASTVPVFLVLCVLSLSMVVTPHPSGAASGQHGWHTSGLWISLPGHRAGGGWVPEASGWAPAQSWELGVGSRARALSLGGCIPPKNHKGEGADEEEVSRRGLFSSSAEGEGNAQGHDSRGPRDSSAGSTEAFLHSVGLILGWGSAAFYLASRISQIALNAQRGSAEGLSMAMFVCAFCANCTYGIAILLRAQSIHDLSPKAPWLIGSVGTLSLDIAIYLQAWHLDRKNLERDGARVQESPARHKIIKLDSGRLLCLKEQDNV